MALADILSKIETDGGAEAQAILDAATKRAEGVLERAKAEAAAHTAQVVASAEKDARRQADTRVVSARLGARDRAVAARRELVNEALSALEDRLATLPDDEYAEFLAGRITSVARGGETLRLGSADQARSQAILSAVEGSSKVSPVYSDEPAPFERGALLEGERVRVDLSLASIIDDERDRLEAIAGAVLFNGEA